MTLNEFKDKIAGYYDLDWLNNLEININYAQINFKLKLQGITAIYEFLSQQYDGWNSLKENIPNEFKYSRTQFEEISIKIIQLINMPQNNSGNRNSLWIEIKNQIENNKNNQFKFTYNCPETEFLIKIFNEIPDYFKGAYDFIIGNFSAINSNKNNFSGAILASEFILKDKSNIANRIDAEQSSLSKLRTDFQKYLSESESHLSKHLDKSNKLFIEYSTAIDDTKKIKETIFDEWFTTTKNQFSDFNTNSNKKIIDLEKTYEELLRLQKPADYWNKRALILKGEGWKAVYWLVGLVVFACITLYFLLWLTPEGMLLSFIKGDASAIKWSIIYVTFISFLAYGIRALNKLVFSSFHLARDAEEREQLTYVYLALIKDKSVDEKDRHLIIQSLFSRADTGLLKEDSSPSMPGNYIEKAFKGN